MNKKFVMIFIIISLVFSLSAMTSESYEKDDTIFGLSLGTSFNIGTAWSDQSNYTNAKKLYPGGNGSLSFMYLILPELRIGGEVGYFFNYTKKSSLFKQVPITFNIAWGPRYKFIDFPLTLKIGIQYLSHNNYQYIAPMINTSFGMDFYINKNWGIGLETGCSFVGEFYAKNPKANNVNFMVPLTINVKFRR